jgi:predicted HTH transcriptional regulator
VNRHRYQAYEGCNEKRRTSLSEDGDQSLLYDYFYASKVNAYRNRKVARKGGQKPTERQALILKLIGDNTAVSRKELSEKLGINESSVQKHLSRLKENGLLKRVGPAKGGHWEIITK